MTINYECVPEAKLKTTKKPYQGKMPRDGLLLY